MRKRVVNKLSHSQISAWEWCRLKEHFQYIQKLKPDKPAQPLAFGIGFHEAVEYFLRSYYINGDTRDLAVSNALSLFDYSYTFDQRGDDLAYYLPMGKRMLTSLFDDLQRRDIIPLRMEEYVSGYIDSNLEFVGKIDCVATLNQKRVIIDWKTAKERYSSEKVRTDNQLTGYAWLNENSYDELYYVIVTKSNAKVYWYKANRTEEQIEKWKTYVLNVKQEMETLRPLGRHDWHCNYCEYNGWACQGNGDF